MSGTLNQKAKGEILFEIDFTPKGKKAIETVYVYAKDRLGASNYLVLSLDVSVYLVAKWLSTFNCFLVWNSLSE